MKKIGIVCEYNPFHEGHLYHIQQTKRAFPHSQIICAMSGNFVQRGQVAVFDKFSRARTALENGADIVVEMPVIGVLTSAGNFAKCGIKLLEGCGAEIISFGCETDNLELLIKTAKILKDEPIEFKTILKSKLATGMSYAKARHEALLNFLGQSPLATPNATLGVEYIINMVKSQPFLVKRHPNYSATAKRKEMDHPICNDDLSQVVTYCLQDLNYLLTLPDFGEGLAQRLFHSAQRYQKFSDIAMDVKTKRYAYTRIQRFMLCALLRITADKQQRFFKSHPNYARVLGVKRESLNLMSEILLPLITTPNICNEFLETDLFASTIYGLTRENSPNQSSEFSRLIIV